MMIYLLAYLFMNLGAFLVVTLIHNQDGTFDLRDYPGLYRRAPFLTVAMAIFLLSLMGIPPLVGFMGKLYVFAAIIERGPSTGWYAVVGALNAAIAAYYYARVLKTMIIDAPATRRRPPSAGHAGPGLGGGPGCRPTCCRCCSGAASRSWARACRRPLHRVTEPASARAPVRHAQRPQDQAPPVVLQAARIAARSAGVSPTGLAAAQAVVPHFGVPAVASARPGRSHPRHRG